MARKQSGRRPHKVGDRPGLKFRLGEEQTIQIGPDISVAICKEAGRFVAHIYAPSHAWTLTAGEKVLQKLPVKQ
jgi:hypothetical protein